jgi:hypothetical protein
MPGHVLETGVATVKVLCCSVDFQNVEKTECLLPKCQKNECQLPKCQKMNVGFQNVKKTECRLPKCRKSEC